MASVEGRPRNGGSFKPGVSGNPGGSTHEVHAKVKAAQVLALEHVHKAFDLHIAVLDEALRAKNNGVSSDEWAENWAKSADFIADRALGKPRQATELTGADGGPLVPPVLIIRAVSPKDGYAGI